MIHGSTEYYRRYWILLVLRAATLSGNGTISSDLFHRLVYFVNALMPAVGLKSETARVLKASYGPFFPEYQWDLDRLVGMRLISVVDLEWVSEDQRFFGKYRIAGKGITLAERIASTTPFFSDVERAISEIVSSFISAPSALSARASHLDANFGQDTIRDGQVVDFGEWQTENFSTNAAEFLFESWLLNLVKNGLDRTALPRTSPVENIANEGQQINSLEQTEEEVTVQSSSSIFLRPSTAHREHKRAFHLYAHYLVQSLSRVSPITVSI